MKTEIPHPAGHQETREALRAMCGRYDSADWQKVDTDRGYPEGFVDALTEAGLMAALFPSEYGGCGLGVAEGPVIMPENNFPGINSGVLHGQMYVAEHMLGLPRSF